MSLEEQLTHQQEIVSYLKNAKTYMATNDKDTTIIDEQIREAEIKLKKIQKEIDDASP